MKTQPVNQRHENGTVTNLLRANYILDGAVQFAPEQLFFLQATRQRTVSGGNSYHSVRSLPIPTIPIHCTLRLSRTLSPRLSLCLRGSYIYMCVCVPLKSSAFSRAQAMAAIQKRIAKIPPIEDEQLLSLFRCIGKSRSVE